MLARPTHIHNAIAHIHIRTQVIHTRASLWTPGRVGCSCIRVVRGAINGRAIVVCVKEDQKTGGSFVRSRKAFVTPLFSCILTWQLTGLEFGIRQMCHRVCQCPRHAGQRHRREDRVPRGTANQSLDSTELEFRPNQTGTGNALVGC